VFLNSCVTAVNIFCYPSDDLSWFVFAIVLKVTEISISYYAIPVARRSFRRTRSKKLDNISVFECNLPTVLLLLHFLNKNLPSPMRSLVQIALKVHKLGTVYCTVPGQPFGRISF
jgi:hypothetical protein